MTSSSSLTPGSSAYRCSICLADSAHWLACAKDDCPHNREPKPEPFPFFAQPEALLHFLKNGAAGNIEGDISGWPQFRAACRWAVEQIEARTAASERGNLCDCNRFPERHDKTRLCKLGYNEFLGEVQHRLIQDGYNPPAWPEPTIRDQGDIDSALDSCVQWCEDRLMPSAKTPTLSKGEIEALIDYHDHNDAAAESMECIEASQHHARRSKELQEMLKNLPDRSASK